MTVLATMYEGKKTASNGVFIFTQALIRSKILNLLLLSKGLRAQNRALLNGTPKNYRFFT